MLFKPLFIEGSSSSHGSGTLPVRMRGDVSVNGFFIDSTNHDHFPLFYFPTSRGGRYCGVGALICFVCHLLILLNVGCQFCQGSEITSNYCTSGHCDASHHCRGVVIAIAHKLIWDSFKGWERVLNFLLCVKFNFTATELCFDKIPCHFRFSLTTILYSFDIVRI